MTDEQIKQEISGRYVIQDRKTGMYLKHDGSESSDHPYDDVERLEDATTWLTLEHAKYVLWWYADMNGDYRIISVKHRKKYIKDKDRGIGAIIEEGPNDYDHVHNYLTKAHYALAWANGYLSKLDKVPQEMKNELGNITLHLQGIKDVIESIELNAERPTQLFEPFRPNLVQMEIPMKTEEEERP